LVIPGWYYSFVAHIHLLPREKLEQRGVQALSDRDLVTVILGSGVDGRSVVEIARSVSRLISRTVDVIGERETTLTWKDFTCIRGVGCVKAMQIECALELGRRMHKSEKGHVSIIRCRNDVVSLVGYLAKRRQEHVVVLSLNARNEVIGKKTVAVGSMNKSIVEPREVFAWALLTNAAGIILVHNHPSGDVSPSMADQKFVERMRKAGDLLGIEVIDQVIV